MFNNEQDPQEAALEEEEVLLVAMALMVRGRRQRRRRRVRNRKRFWVRPWLLRRPLYGQYEHLMQELYREDVNTFTNFLRVTPEMFMELVERVGPRIEKEDTLWRKALEPGLRLAITLRYMATGDSYRSLQYGFRVAANTISTIVYETCEAIAQEYTEEVMPTPKPPEAWKEVADEFSTRWNFHNSLGAIDGKHVAIKCPRNSGSFYYNYKGFYSIILLAIVDAAYKFLYVDIGANGSCSDGGVFKDCDIYQALDQGTAGLPEPQPLPKDDQPLPFAIIGDDAFARYVHGS